MDLQKDMQQQLYASRVKLRKEMQRALACISKPSKRSWQKSGVKHIRSCFTKS